MVLDEGVKLLAVVLVAGTVGVALGITLSWVTDEPEQPESADRAVAGTRTNAARAATPTSAAPAATATERAPAPAVTAAAPPARAEASAQVRVRVLDALLRMYAPPSGRYEQPSEMTVRLQIENLGEQRVTLERPTLGVGSVRIDADPEFEPGSPGGGLSPLETGESRSVSVLFALTGEATPKVVRDRRARILVAGQFVPMRVELRAPAR